MVILSRPRHYPFGLTMAGISNKALTGVIENKKKFNEGTELGSKEFNDGSGLDWYETNFRTLDPQLGRFWQIDPLSFAAVTLSTYQFANNNPIRFNDRLGLLSDSTNPQSLPEIVITGKKKDKTTPYQLGVEWLTGKGPREHHFKANDPFTQMVQRHSHVKDTRRIIVDSIKSGNKRIITGANSYDLSGLGGISKYVKDYSTILTGGLTGNLAVTFLGSYTLKYEVVSIDDKSDTAIVNFYIENYSSAASGFRPPVLGYEEIWQNSVGRMLNETFSSGPMSKTKQTVEWTEKIKWK